MTLQLIQNVTEHSSKYLNSRHISHNSYYPTTQFPKVEWEPELSVSKFLFCVIIFQSPSRGQTLCFFHPPVETSSWWNWEPPQVTWPAPSLAQRAQWWLCSDGLGPPPADTTNSFTESQKVLRTKGPPPPPYYIHVEFYELDFSQQTIPSTICSSPLRSGRLGHTLQSAPSSHLPSWWQIAGGHSAQWKYCRTSLPALKQRTSVWGSRSFCFQI